MNIRIKGKTGEQEIVRLLKGVLVPTYKRLGFDDDFICNEHNYPQRNQNQTATGGADIVTFGLAIEVKRQEALSVNTWWKQCVNSAKQIDCYPVLLYRQNRKPWKCVTICHLPFNAGNVVSEIHMDDFLSLYIARVRAYFEN